VAVVGVIEGQPEGETRLTECDGTDPYEHIVEVRVHGVSGTAPQDLLDRTSVRHVAGDRIAGFYRPVHRDEMRDHAPNAAGEDSGPGLEAYSWGGWTSGSRSRALWLPFFPFALVNVAPRMLPPSKSAATANVEPFDVPSDKNGVTRRHRVAYYLCRLLALSLTIQISFGAAYTGLVLVGGFCRAYPRSGATFFERALQPDPSGGRPPWLSTLLWLPGLLPSNRPRCFGFPDFLANFLASRGPGLQLLVGLAVPALFIVFLWIVSGRSIRRYEEVPAGGETLARHPEYVRTPLTRLDLWNGRLRVRRMRRIHVHTAGAAVVVMASSGGTQGVALLPVIFGLAIIGYSLVAVQFRIVESEPPTWEKLERWINWAVLGVATWLTVSHLLRAGNREPTPIDLQATVVRYNSYAFWIFVAQGVLVFGIFAVTLLIRVTPKAGLPPMRLWGMATFVFAFLGWLFGVMVTNAVIILSAAWLFTPGFSFTPATITGFVRTQRGMLGDSALSAGYGMLVAVGAIITIAIIATSVLGGVVFRDRIAYRRNSNIRRKRKMMLVARLIDFVTWFLMPFVCIMATFLILQAVGTWVEFRIWFLRPSSWRVEGGDVNAPPVAWGAFSVAAVLGIMIVVSAASMRSRGVRRGVGVLWDLACFWPRDVHPFAPPTYTERAVPELLRRLQAYDKAKVNVIIAAHSQGTVIAAAALLAAPRGSVRKVGLLTFGTVLDRLYSRMFPRFFDQQAFGELSRRLPENPVLSRGIAWSNLSRTTDYLGGAIPFPYRSDAEWSPRPEEKRLVDPYPLRAPADGVMPNPAGKHSNYWRDPVFQTHIGKIAQSFTPADDLCVPEPGGRGFPSEPRTL
jgi:hypothetical protein